MKPGAVVRSGQGWGCPGWTLQAALGTWMVETFRQE